MRRSVAVAWHASFFVLACVLFFVFVVPRWYELLYYWTPTLGNPVRIVDGVLIGLCALPVVFTLQRLRKPELATPALSLSLLVGSIVLHVLAGVLIVGTAISEYWLDLDRTGQWLFGIYGAAAALALLGALAFYLAFLAAMPPPPPKPRKVRTSRRGRRRNDDADDPEPTVEPETETEPAAELPPATDDVTEAPAPADNPTDAEATPGDAEGRLRNRRPAGKSITRRFGRRSGGVALDD